jgi:7-carboxy-7-deazaguanine synthase
MNINEINFNISEIFYSIQGEGSRAGERCVFVRLQGCELRCSWCDSEYALDLKQQEHQMTGQDIFEKIQEYDCDYVLFTGGEPLNQPDILHLMNYLCDIGYVVSIETNGHMPVAEIDPRVIKVMDLKCPGSAMVKFNNFDNIDHLTQNDEVKFVIASEEDYIWAKAAVEEYALLDKAGFVYFSPVFGSINAQDLAEYILRDNLSIRMQLQLHKYIWDPKTRGV